jgi:hypothetical protein
MFRYAMYSVLDLFDLSFRFRFKSSILCLLDTKMPVVIKLFFFFVKVFVKFAGLNWEMVLEQCMKVRPEIFICSIYIICTNNIVPWHITKAVAKKIHIMFGHIPPCYLIWLIFTFTYWKLDKGWEMITYIINNCASGYLVFICIRKDMVDERKLIVTQSRCFFDYLYKSIAKSWFKQGCCTLVSTQYVNVSIGKYIWFTASARYSSKQVFKIFDILRCTVGVTPGGGVGGL